MSTGKKPRRFVKPGLWFSTMKAEVEYVNSRMKKKCGTCGELPERMRLKVTKGSGRHATTTVYCQECGDHWIEEFKDLAQRAEAYLMGAVGPIASIRKPSE
jgi:hypothetical protein